MERLRTQRPRGLTRASLRTWAMLFLAMGILGRGILQTRYLNVANLDSEQLLQLLTNTPGAMAVATTSLVLQFMECCAVPIFCLLLADGFSNTSDAGKYLLRVLGVALLSEIPFNFAMSAKFLDMSSRNPAFGIALSLMLLYLYGYFTQKTAAHLLARILVTVAAFVWCYILRIEHGVAILMISLVYWLFREKPMFRNLAGGAAAMLCCIFSMFYMAAPMGVMINHFYNGEKGRENRVFSYLFYPAALSLCGVIGYLVFSF